MGFNDGFSTQGVPFVTGAAGGQVLTWNDTTSQWVAADPTGGGGGGTVETSGNITGSGTASNKVRLKDDISLTSVTASSFNASSSNPEDSKYKFNDRDVIWGHANLVKFGYDDNNRISIENLVTNINSNGKLNLDSLDTININVATKGLLVTSSYSSFNNQLTASNGLYVENDQSNLGNILVDGYVSASQGFTGSFSGSFVGDGSGLINVPAGIQSIEFDRVVYVNSGGSGTSGSFDDPFGTIQEAINYINTKYTSGESVLVNIGPGTYSSPSTITRRNLYFKGQSSKYEQRSVTFAGPVEVSCSYTAGRMFTDIVGFEGIFFNGGGLSNPTFKVSTNSYTTYLKDCYIAASTGQNALLLTSDLTTTFGNGARLSAKDCYFWRASGDADLIVVNGGSCKFDTIEIGYTGVASAGTAIKQTGDSTIQIDRLLVDVATNVAAISSSATLGASPRLLISNSSLLSSGSANAIINNTNLFIVNSYLGNNISANPAIAGSGIVSYGSLTSIGILPITINALQKVPLAETFGNSSFNSLSASSGITGSFNGNGAGLNGILTSSITNFTSSVRSLFSGSGIISYNSSSGEISTSATVLTGVLTDANFAGSGTIAQPLKLADTISIKNISVTEDATVTRNLFVNGTASIAFLETLAQDSLKIGDKYITILSGANNHNTAIGSGILWGSGSTDNTQGPESSIAAITYLSGTLGKPQDVLEIYPGLYVSGTITANSFSGNGALLTGVTASTFNGIENYATITGSNSFRQSQIITGTLTVTTSVSSSQLTGSLFGTASNADRLGGQLPSYYATTGLNTFSNNQTVTGSLYVQNVVSASQFTGSFSGSFNGNIQTADTATNALNLGGKPAVNYALTGSSNTFTGDQIVTGSLRVSTNISASSGITGSFSGSGANITNLTGSNWNGGTSSFFANVRDAFVFDTSITTGSAPGGRYALTASGGSGGSSAGAQLTYVSTITGSSPLPALSSGMIVGISGANVVQANNSNILSSNIVGVVSGTSGANIIISIAGEVSASKSGSTVIDGGTPVYLSDDPGKYTTYDNVGVGKYIVQVGILGPLDNKVILQPRIFGIKG